MVSSITRHGVWDPESHVRGGMKTATDLKVGVSWHQGIYLLLRPFSHHRDEINQILLD